nr:phage integrase SAM-like domain-containing protein [Cytobacillus dafuensis]
MTSWKGNIPIAVHIVFNATKTKGGFRTKRECENADAEIEKKLQVGQDITAGDQLFTEYMRNWYELYKKGKYCPKHEPDIERSVKLAEQHFPGVKLKELTRNMYQRFINELAPQYATETVRKRHIYIKNSIRDAIEDGSIIKDPTYKVTIKGHKSKKSEELKYLNFEEVKKLVKRNKKRFKA